MAINLEMTFVPYYNHTLGLLAQRLGIDTCDGGGGHPAQILETLNSTKQGMTDGSIFTAAFV